MMMTFCVFSRTTSTPQANQTNQTPKKPSLKKQYAMSRTFVMLGRMGLIPPILARVSARTQSPIIAVLACGALSAVLALFVPLEALADLTSMGALFAFCTVALAVLFRCVHARLKGGAAAFGALCCAHPPLHLPSPQKKPITTT
jgi:hypothetical protein